ncbi:MAG TPA: hypothetical protein VLX92_17815 [Kofleriaceae bacterium]|nr:hypothetical protein [Kofleriaceae bacterium]
MTRALAIALAAAALFGCKKKGGGRHIELVYSLDLDQAVDDRLVELRRSLQAALAADQLAATVATSPSAQLVVRGLDAAGTQRLAQHLAHDYADQLIAVPCHDADAACVALAPPYAASVKAAALTSAASIVRARFESAGFDEPEVATRDGKIVIDVAAQSADQMETAEDLVPRRVELAFDVVDDGAPFMHRLCDRAAATAGSDQAVRCEVDQWQDAAGTEHRDGYLHGRDRNSLEQAVRELAASEPVPPDRRVAFGPIDRGWRSYYVEAPPALTGNAISNAVVSYDANGDRPVVLLDFNPAGGQELGELTTRIVGKKLAIELDGTIQSAAVITGPIRGGRASIAMGNGPPDAMERDARTLVQVLHTGSLPAPLVLDSINER